MTRDTDELVARLLGWLPPDYAAASDLLAAFAAVLAKLEELVEELAPLVTIGAGEGIWLTLQAQGYGLERDTDEGDTALRQRMRNIEDAVTPVALVNAVNDLLAPYTTQQARIQEWFEEPYLDVDDEEGAWLDQRRPATPKTFRILIHFLGTGFGPGEHPLYSSVVAEIERLRAADFTWRLVLE